MTDTYIRFMKEAIKEAVKGYKKDEVPVGAIVVKGNKIISRAHSAVRKLKDPTNHAEILAIKKASKKLNNERLTGTTMYVTVEPCSMCAGAMVLARIKELIFGATQPKTGGVKSVFKIVNSGKLNHSVKVISGVLAFQCREMMRKFFLKKRQKN